jgi:hypothetical protein
LSKLRHIINVNELAKIWGHENHKILERNVKIPLELKVLSCDTTVNYKCLKDLI